MKLLLSFLIVVMFAACGNSDKDIAGEVNNKLMAANPNVRATVKDGVVTLTGTCPDASCKNVSETAAKEVKGVKQVVNEIQVSPPPTPEPTVAINTDDSLNTAVTTVLSKYKGVNAQVNDGVVTLTGELKRSQLPQLMQDITATKPKRIENKLQLK